MYTEIDELLDAMVYEYKDNIFVYSIVYSNLCKPKEDRMEKKRIRDGGEGTTDSGKEKERDI